MPARPARFTQADLARAARAMAKAGLTVTGARIDVAGNIEVLCGPPKAAEAETILPRTLDDWRRERGKNAG